jgi:hypothetical protein
MPGSSLATHPSHRSDSPDDSREPAGAAHIDRRKSEIDVIEHVIGGVRALLQERADDRPTPERPRRKPRR